MILFEGKKMPQGFKKKGWLKMMQKHEGRRVLDGSAKDDDDDDGDYYSKMISSVITACYASYFWIK